MSTAALQKKRLLDPDTLVDHFKVLRLIGRGGMGEVYLARDTKLGRKVALKMIHLEQVDSEEAVSRFLLEARVTASFSHPNIVTVYAVGEYQGRPYLALEYLEGQTLRQRMSEGRPGVKESIRIGVAVSKALAEAHKNRVLHRDLKPENILLAKDGRPRVLDLGLAKIVEPTSREGGDDVVRREVAKEGPLRPGQVGQVGQVGELGQLGELREDASDAKCVYGTPAYVPPERWLGLESTEAADVWALGVILHELIAGRRPYQEASLHSLREKTASDELIPRLATTTEVSGELSALIAGCLEKDPRARSSAGVVAETLEQMLLGSRRQLSEEQSPFRGLLSFGERHSDYFFGRDLEIDAFLETIREQPVLPIVGPSGAGKSSFVQAGIIPRLREQGSWIVLPLRPGNDPFMALAARFERGESTLAEETTQHSLHTTDLRPAAPTDVGETARQKGGLLPIMPITGGYGDAGTTSTARSAAEGSLAQRLRESPRLLNLFLHQLAEQESCRVLLFVDQVEEVHTLVDDEVARRAFLQAICTAADDAQSPVRVIFTVRDDFLGRIAEGSEIRAALSRVTVLRTPGPEALREILVRPLESVGYNYDDAGLVDEMIATVSNEPASLPLLQFTCQMLWSRRDRTRRLVCRATYQSIGGVAGALAEHADGILAGLSPAQVGLAREVLLRLVTPDGTRRVIPVGKALEGLTVEADEVLSRLTQSRLVTVRKGKGGEHGEAVLELVHESLIRTWSRLARWIEESREELSFLAEITQAAELWHRRGQRPEEVWFGLALHEAEAMLKRCSTRAPAIVTAFLEAGLRKERRITRRKQTLAAAGAGILVLIAAASLLVAQERQQQKNRAEAERAEAQREGSRAALGRGDLLEARAKLRGSLETNDSILGRALWWRLEREHLVWRRDLAAVLYGVAYSPDGRRLAAACQDGLVYLVDVTTAAVHVLRGHHDQVMAVVFSPDGKRLAATSTSGRIRIWDLALGKTVTMEHGSLPVYAVNFSPDGSLFVTGSNDRSINVWNAASGERIKTLHGHDDSVWGLAFSPDSKTLVSAGLDGKILYWDRDQGTSRTMATLSDGVWRIAFSPDGKRLVSAGFDRILRIWDVSSGVEQLRLEGHRAAVNGAAFSPDGSLIASGSFDKTIRIWDARLGIERQVLVGHSDIVRDVALSPDGRFVASVANDKSLRLWRVPREGGRPRAAMGHTADVWGAAFTSDGRFLASGGADNVVRLWRVATGVEERTISGHTARVSGVTFSPDGMTLATGSSDATVRTWNLETGVQQRLLVGHTEPVFEVTVSPDGALLASGSWDKTIRIWDLATGTSRAVLTGHNGRVLAVAFSPDGRLLASGSQDHTMRIWETSTGKTLAVIHGHEAPVYGVAFRPDGRLLASASADTTVRLWQPEDGTAIRVLEQEGRSHWLSFDPSGARLAVPLSDGRTALVDVESGKTVHLRGHRGEVNFARFSPAGDLLATTSDDGTVRLWNADGRPYWRGPILLPSPPEIATHLGFKQLDTATAANPAASRPSSWRRALEERAKLAAWPSDDGRLICLVSGDEALEIWDRATDRQLAKKSIPGVRQIVSLSRGCAYLAGEKAALLAVGGNEAALADNASALSWDRNDLLLAAGTTVSVLDVSNAREPTSARETGAYHVDAGVTAMMRAGGWLVLGYQQGDIQLVPLGGHDRGNSRRQARPTFSFEATPSSPVVSLREGPAGTLVAGYANGVVGMWSLKNGTLLDQAKLHGPVIHMLFSDGKFYAATELGDSLVLDVSVFHAKYCDLLRQVWDRVPVVWEEGLPVVRPAPHRHSCARRQ
ncbi:MAG: protein kinase [Pseudomonadota bacterium]